MEKKIIVAIDGYSGTGKSSTAKCVARKLNYTYIDSGAMYRATTLKILQENIPTNDLKAIEGLLDHIKIDFSFSSDTQKQHAFLNGIDVENEIRKMYVSEKVSEVSKIPFVRSILVKKQKDLGNQKQIVMDGRDIGTVVFPEAELKIFMSADVEVRAKRRQLELQAKGQGKVELQEIIDNLKKRDEIDTSRKESPLKKADDAIELDTTHLSLEEQCNKIVILAKKKIEGI